MGGLEERSRNKNKSVNAWLINWGVNPPSKPEPTIAATAGKLQIIDKEDERMVTAKGNNS